ncbi:MAG: helix-turn-helix domain-containing protein [Dysgonomonas sp.]
MIPNYTVLYDKAFKKFTLGFLYIILTAYILDAFLYSSSNPLKYILLAGAILNITPIIIIHYTPTDYIKKSIKAFLIIALIPIYASTVLSLLKGIVTPLFWHIVIPIYIYTIFPSKGIFKWLIFCICFMLLTVAMSLTLNHIMYNDALIIFEDMTLFQMLFTEVINAFFALIAVCYCLYYIHSFQQIRANQRESSVDSVNEKENVSIVLETKEEQKYEKIYEQIIEYIEDKEPYLNPNFRITQMGYDLDINVAYLTKAIRQNKDINFNNLINHYRIERAKELIQTNTSKYTLEYIYMSSGFKSQSSFNRAFKQLMDITPSEYYKQITNIKK